MYFLNKKKQHNQTDSTTCQKTKYHVSADIINSWELGVKVSNTILDIFRVPEATHFSSMFE